MARLRRLVPTSKVSRGLAAPKPLPRCERDDAVTFRVPGSDRPMTWAESLVADGTLDAGAKVAQYVPELKDSAFGDATLRQVLDMTTGLKCSEDSADPKAEIWDHVRAGNVVERPPGWTGPDTFYEFLVTVKKQGNHGDTFACKTVITDVAYFAIDTVGTGFAGGRFNGQQIVPKAVVDDIRRGADKAQFAKAGYPLLPGCSYRDMW